MDDLIVRSLQGKIGTLEERRLRSWRLESQENERHYQQLARIWQIKPVDGASDVAPPRPRLGRILREAEARRTATAAAQRRTSSQLRTWVRRGAVAAALVVSWSLAQSWLGGPSGSVFGAEEMATGSAETAMLALTDGSLVRLAPNSRLRISGAGAQREVWLDGRAYFAVQSDPDDPFIVRTRAGTALALGTRFEVRVERENLRLAVVEGRVALSAGTETIEVDAGEIGHIREGDQPSVVRVEDVHEILDWPRGLLVFQSTPLEEVGRALERHFDIAVDITEQEVAHRVITGWFTEESLDEVLTAVCRATRTRCSLDGNRVIITP